MFTTAAAGESRRLVACAAPDCDCQKVVEGIGARVPVGKDNLTAAEVGRRLGLSVHTLTTGVNAVRGREPSRLARAQLVPSRRR